MCWRAIQGEFKVVVENMEMEEEVEIGETIECVYHRNERRGRNRRCINWRDGRNGRRGRDGCRN